MFREMLAAGAAEDDLVIDCMTVVQRVGELRVPRSDEARFPRKFCQGDGAPTPFESESLTYTSYDVAQPRATKPDMDLENS